jgi:hypothetical protein
MMLFERVVPAGGRGAVGCVWGWVAAALLSAAGVACPPHAARTSMAVNRTTNKTLFFMGSPLNEFSFDIFFEALEQLEV